jgi:hypothetical protein
MLWLAVAAFLVSQILPVFQYGDRAICGWEVTSTAVSALGKAGQSPTGTSFLLVLYFAGLGTLANLLFLATLAARSRGSRRAAIWTATLGLGAAVLCLTPIAAFAGSSLRAGALTWIVSLVALVLFSAPHPESAAPSITG